jgi:hypothetical protein
MNMIANSAAFKESTSLAALQTIADATPAGNSVMTLFREWEVLNKMQYRPGPEDDETASRDCDRMAQIEDEIMRLPTTSAAEFAAKFIVVSGDGGFCIDENGSLFEEARALVTPDADLIALEKELDGASANERAVYAENEHDDSGEADARCAEAYERTANVVEKIEALPTTTLDGLRVKAKCVEWCCAGDPKGVTFGNTTDVRIAAHIVRLLLGAAS